MLKLVALLSLACCLTASVVPKPPATHKENISEAPTVKSTPLHPSQGTQKPLEAEKKHEELKTKEAQVENHHEEATTQHGRMINHPHVTTSHSQKVVNQPVAHAEPKNKVVLVEKKPEETKEQKH